jgi:multidrug efflux system outer membrane protein
MKLTMTPLLAALMLAACATPPAIDGAALRATPATYKAAARADGLAVADGRWSLVPPAELDARGDWWRVFNDATLDTLIQRALANNTELRSAAARLLQARALLGSADAARMPQLDLVAGGARGTPAGTSPSSTGLLNAANASTTHLTSVGASLSYELDLAGRLSQASRAAAFDTQTRAALLQNARLMVEAEVAQSYLALRFVDQERRLLADTLLSYRDTLALTRHRVDAGRVGELDLVRMQGDVAATEAEALGLDRQRAELENALAVLLGEPASGFRLADDDAALPVLPAIPGGLPSAMLARRPDVSAAERSLLAAQARVGVAQAAWFPSLTLTSAAGFASTALGEVFRWSARAWSVEALLALPLFDGGRREAGLDSAHAGLDLAMADYRQQILQALREVEDALSDLQLLSRQLEAQSQSVRYSERATAIAESRYRNGLVSQLDLLDARRGELRQRRQALQLQAARYQATVGLIRALGGSWS